LLAQNSKAIVGVADEPRSNTARARRRKRKALTAHGPSASRRKSPVLSVGELIVEFLTTLRSKARIIGNMAVAIQNGELKFNQDECPNLRTELLGYMSDDEFCVTDCVMSLAVALDQAGSIPTPGRVMAIIEI